MRSDSNEPPTSPTRTSDAEEVLLRAIDALVDPDADDVDGDALAASHPDLADGIRVLVADWRYARDMFGNARGPAGG
ncbi:MAG: hypothetical protein H6674_10885 [Dehalococcoidia bacterium]|nr:hypothetical protein [Dehalococcoidia bacterium]